MVDARSRIPGPPTPDPLSAYRLWLERFAPPHDKVREQFDNAITWMEANRSRLDEGILAANDHPALAFNHVISALTERCSTDPAARSTIITWLCENRRCPFGMTLKVKAFRVLRRCGAALGADQVDRLRQLQAEADAMPYRPREVLQLDRLLAGFDQREER